MSSAAAQPAIPAQPPLLARLNWYWICQLGGWLLVGLANLMLYSKLMAGTQLVCLWMAISGIGISHLWRAFAKRRGWVAKGMNWKLALYSFLVLGPLQTASVALAIHVLLQRISDLSWLPITLIVWGSAFLGWNICYSMALSMRRANRFEAETLRLELLAKDAELRALQAQVNPHFFFNSLNSVRALIYENRDAAALMIDQLAALMRYTLQSDQADTVKLAQELEAVQAYLAIEKIRFEDRLRVRIDVEDGMENIAVPPMSVQTLVENAVKYGVEMSAGGSEIRIQARRGEGSSVIEVANAGAIRPFSNSTHIGLANARKRLILAMGKEASLDLSESEGWVRATMQLPAIHLPVAA
ncbi:sensor histidine kinase [Massilia sp. erpn]|uniref:sensor histidine kinase n=1 Tax=Massilia sp. erpn TaxID=2738142 RepID=UPI0021026AAA|nr:histidine kinase [Massilia sp. erpn]UTY55739.1 histidine kinase [Massilia sp. erpn]